MKDILQQMGEVYTGAEINAWIAHQYKMNTPYKRIAIDFLRAYGNFGLSHIDRRYMICRTADYPKSAKANGNRDGEYMLRRVGSRHNYRGRFLHGNVRADFNVFYV